MKSKIRQNEKLAVVITPTDTYILAIQRQIDQKLQTIIKEYLFKDIVKILTSHVIINSYRNNIIISALQSGKIYYNLKNQAFMGNLSMSIIKELESMGGHYDGKKQAIYILLSNLPNEIRTIAQNKAIQFQQNVYSILNVLENGLKAVSVLAIASIVAPYVKTLLNQTADKFKKDNIQTEQDIVDTLINEYANNIDIKIKGFADKITAQMKEDLVNKILYEGNDTKLKEYIQGKYNFSKTRTELITRQETVNAYIALQNDRYLKAGFSKYYWINPDPDNPNRRDGHFILSEHSKDGVVYTIGNNPIDPVTGKPTEPGIEFNCNCYKQIVK